jgi:hypothetical protein
LELSCKIGVLIVYDKLVGKLKSFGIVEEYKKEKEEK